MIVIPNERQPREQLVTASAWVREQLRRADIGQNFTLTIKVEGPIQTGEALLTYQLDHSRNYDSSVSGNSLNEVTFELLRRSGWKASNHGLQLTWEGGSAASLEKEF